MPAKLTQVSVEPVGEVPETASVRHCDELPWRVREMVAQADSGGSTVTVDPYRAALVEECGCDVVKSTEYIRLERV